MRRHPLHQATVRWFLLTIAFFIIAWGIVIYSLVNTSDQFFLIAFLATVAYAVWTLMLIRQALNETRATQKQLEASIAQQQESQVALERQLRETLLLNRVITTATSSLESDKILTMICEELARAFDLPQAGVALLSADGTHETVVAEYRAPDRPSAIGIVIPMEGNRATQTVIDTREPLVLTDAQTDPRQPSLHEIEKQRGTVSLLIIPLIARDRVIGTLGLESTTPREFTTEEIALAQMVANTASQVLESARLTEELHQELAERRNAQARLQATFVDVERAQTKARSILDATADSMLLVTTEQRITATNWSFCRNFFGKHPREVVGQTLLDCQHEFERLFESPAEFRRLVQESATDTEQSFTGIIVQKLPRRRELQIVSTPVRTATNEHLGRLYVFHDVTQEREVDRLKNEFVSMVSHELRSPLTSIKGYVDLLQTGAFGSITAEQDEFLGIIKSNTDRLVNLINDLLDISRIEAGRIELHNEAVDLALILHQVVNTFRPQTDAKNQHVTLTIAADIPPVWADRDRLIQIVTNLVSNAHKYTPPGGNISIGAHLGDEGVQVSVKDDGIGISPADQAQLFTKFFRSKDLKANQVPGTGLGLAITRSLVEMHGGKLWVTSEVGQGATFHFTLPIQIPGTPVAPSTGKRVLIVDDDHDFMSVLWTYLERGGYQVLAANNANDALHLAREQRPDLITLDLLLPEIDGFALLQSLRRDPATRNIPTIIISVLAQREEGKLLGAANYLSKPITEHSLLHHVAKTLEVEHPNLILLAQGDEHSRQRISTLLQSAGYDTCQAGNSDDALSLIQTQMPSIAFLDLKLPGKDAIEMLRVLRNDERTRRLPVVVIPGYDGISNEHRAAIAELSAPTILTQPVTAQKLATAIYQAVYLGQP